MFTLKLTPIWLFIILITVLIIGSIFGFSGSILEGHENRRSSSVFDAGLKQAEESLRVLQALPSLPGFPSDLKPAVELLTDDTIYIVNKTKDLQSELRITSDKDTNADSIVIIDRIHGELTIRLDTLKKANPNDPLIKELEYQKTDMTDLKQLAKDVPKSIFRSVINMTVNAYTHMMHNGKTAFSKISKFLDPKSVLDDATVARQYQWAIDTLKTIAPGAVTLIPVGTPLLSKIDENDSFYKRDGHDEKRGHYNSDDNRDTYMTSKNAYNRAGEIMNFGMDTYKDTYYCSRRLGKEKIPGSDGQCGPLRGPQCPDCNGYTRQNPPSPENEKFRKNNSFDYKNIDSDRKNTYSSSSDSSDYIRKTQIVPPVCPMCPTCPVGACANCGGNGGSGTIGSNGQSVVPKSRNSIATAVDTTGGALKEIGSEVSGLARDAVSGGAGLTKDAVSGGVGLTKDAVSGGVGLTKDAVSGGVGLTKDAVSGGVGLTKDAVSGGVGLVKDTIHGVGSLISEGVGVLKDIGTGPVRHIQHVNRSYAPTPIQTGPMNPYTYNGALSEKRASNFIPITADFSAFSK